MNPKESFLDELTEIPEGWAGLQWKQQVAIANAIADDRGIALDHPLNGAEARAAINGEINRRAREQSMRERAVDQPDIPEGEKTVPIIILRDTWLGEQRVRASGEPIQWPIAAAKKLIAAKAAERADPLPGDDE
jgi:hypothetical protein